MEEEIRQEIVADIIIPELPTDFKYLNFIQDFILFYLSLNLIKTILKNSLK